MISFPPFAGLGDKRGQKAEQLSLVLLSSLVDKCDVLHCSVQTGDEAAREAKQ
jgi:hypothetical protein